MAEGFVMWLSDPATLLGLGAVAAFAAYYLFSRPSPSKPPIPLARQSLELPGAEKIHVSQFTPDGKLVEHIYEDAKTLYQGFLRGLTQSGDGPCLGERIGPKGEGPYEFLKYSEVLARAHNFGAGLVKIGVPIGQKSFVGIYSRNCTNWVIASLSCDAYSRVVVPLYDTLGPKAVAYAVNQSEVEVVVCHPEKLKTLSSDLDSFDTVKHIVSWGRGISTEVVSQVTDHGLTFHTMEQLEELGKENPVEPQPVTPDDLSTICYTSGTTGNPKGAMLTHKGLIATCSGIQTVLGKEYGLSPADVHISFLPLAHAMERIVQVFLFQHGSSIGFYRGDTKLLLDDIRELKPTIFIVVPRLLNRVYDKVIMGASKSSIKRTLLNIALYFKGKEVDRGIIRKNSIWDMLVFKKMQALLGGRVRYITTGSAPIPKDVLRFCRSAFGCHVFEGYGQTECHAASNLTVPGETKAGHVGPPLPCTMIKLVDVPEMKYFSGNDEGEVCFKGPNVFQGYLKNEEKTREALDDEGWLHSGDVGKWLPNGVLKIIDRKKQIFKTQQGEYIAPEKIENVYLKSMFVQQVFLFGNSLKPCVLAVIVPDEEYLAMWSEQEGINKGSIEALCMSKRVQMAILNDITAIGKAEGLHSFEQAKGIYLHPTPFSIEDGLLTPTQKLVRRNLETKFMSEFERMYSELPN
jgi:long-chain acyl-CoA synthetase